MIPETMSAAMEKPKSQKRRLFWPLIAPRARKRVTNTKRNPGGVREEERRVWGVPGRVDSRRCFLFGSWTEVALGLCMEGDTGIWGYSLLRWIDIC